MSLKPRLLRCRSSFCRRSRSSANPVKPSAYANRVTDASLKPTAAPPLGAGRNRKTSPCRTRKTLPAQAYERAAGPQLDALPEPAALCIAQDVGGKGHVLDAHADRVEEDPLRGRLAPGLGPVDDFSQFGMELLPAEPPGRHGLVGRGK